MDVIGNRNLRWLIEKKVKDYADKEFIVFEDRLGNVHRYTYREFDENVNKYANILNGLGIKQGDKINVHLLNSPEYLFSWFAIAKLGAVMIPTNVLSGAFEMEYFLNFADCVAIITEPYYMDMYKGILDKCPNIKNVLLARTSPIYPNKKLYPDAIIIQDILKDTLPEVPEVTIGPEDDLMMLFTSGTTSRPKAVQLTHANAVFAGIFGSQGYKVGSQDRHFMVLPLFHVNAQFISVMPTLVAGATLVMAEQFSATRYMEQARRHKVTTTSLVAATAKMILAQPKHELDGVNDFRLVMYAIAISDEQWVEFETRFNVQLSDLWGMTETLAETTMNPPDLEMKRNCIGLARPGNEIKVVDEEGQEVPTGKVGEMIVQGVPGRTLMKGYYKNPEATAQTIQNGWLYTGDNAYMDEDGYFYFVDRKKDMIKRGGENVAAVEVEYVISLHPKVQEVAVVGVPDPIRDEAIMALVVLKKGETSDADEIITFCKERLAKFKVPSFVEFKESFPKTSIGKVQKNILRTEEMKKFGKK
jgi:crotonobetaine/carnitine-CoA ligase